MTQANPLFVQSPDISYEAADFRQLYEVLFSEGVLNLPAGELAVTALTDGTLRVQVAAGRASVKGDDVTNQGSYILRCTAAEPVAVSAPPSAGTRLDLLVYEQIDASVVALAGRPAGSRFRAVPGTAVTTGSPVLPPLPPTAIPLASFPVAAGQSTISAASITDLRTQSGAASLQVGTQFVKMTTAQRDAISSPTVGTSIFNTTTNRNETYLGPALGWVAGRVDVQIFTASGTWTKPAGALLVFPYVVAAGGAGFLASTNGSAGAGGEGLRAFFPAALCGATESVQIAAATPYAGATPAAYAADSSFGSLLRARGGQNGNSQPSVGGGATFNGTNAAESGGSSPNSGSSAGEANSMHGGGAGGGVDNTPQFARGGSSNTPSGSGRYGGLNAGGSPGSTTVAGGPGTSRSGTGRAGDGGGGGLNGGAGGVPGGGGGAGRQGTAGGPGARGEVIVYTLCI